MTECFDTYKCIKTTFITSTAISLFSSSLSLFHSSHLYSFSFLFCFPLSSFPSHTFSRVPAVFLLYFFNFLLLHSPFNNFLIFFANSSSSSSSFTFRSSPMNVVWQSVNTYISSLSYFPSFRPSPLLPHFSVPTCIFPLSCSFSNSFIFCLSPYKPHTLTLILPSPISCHTPSLFIQGCDSPWYILVLVRLLLRAWYFLILLEGRSESCKMICVVGPKICIGRVQVPLRTPLTKANLEKEISDLS